MYLGNSILSTEIYVNIRQVKEGSSLRRLSIIWNYDVSDKI